MKFPRPRLHLDERNAILYAEDCELPAVHLALEDDDGRIMVVEWIPDNYPAVGIFTYESKTEYAESVKEVNWVTERSNINDEELAGMLADALTDNDVAINRET